MGIKQKLAEGRVRKIIARRDGRAILDAETSDDREALYDVLSAMKVDALDALLAAYESATTPEEARFALWKIAECRGERALEIVLEATRHQDAGRRADAVQDLGSYWGPEVAERLVEVLRDPDPDVRTRAREALATKLRLYPAEDLPASLETILAASVESEAELQRAALVAQIEGDLSEGAAAALLIRLCDELDVTYGSPVPSDADARRTRLRADIHRIGERLAARDGEHAMKIALNVVQMSSAHASFISREWSGISGWMG